MNSRHDALAGQILGTLPVPTKEVWPTTARLEQMHKEAVDQMCKMQAQGVMQGMNDLAKYQNKVPNPSLADHIEQRTCRMQADLDRLKRIKSQIATNGILNVPMDDLRFAMNHD